MQENAEPNLSHGLTMNHINDLTHRTIALTSDEYQAMEDEFRSILTECHIAYTQLLYMVIKHERNTIRKQADTIIGLQLTIDEMRGDA